MNINIYSLIEGAKKAEGLTVIIDVFRAFSLECYLFEMGAVKIRPVGTVEEAFMLKNMIPDSVLVGERGGRKCEGFDFGNSPSTIPKECVEGKTIIHTTSAGTKGIVNAKGADEIITGSLVNARAVAEYILKKNPQTVSIVCMGNAGIRPAKEDELCGEYIKSIICGQELSDIEERILALKYDGGEHFFRPDMQDVYPEEDFNMCIKYNKFPFVLQVYEDETGLFVKRRFHR